MKVRVELTDLRQYRSRLAQIQSVGIPALEHQLSVAAGGVESSESPAGRPAGAKARHFSNRSIEEFKLRTERAVAVAELVLQLAVGVDQGDSAVREGINGPGPTLPSY
jgi:hypothetical protein